jgi:hypothetical protein
LAPQAVYETSSLKLPCRTAPIDTPCGIFY